jgi:ubiquinone/menaquinone biosynthesis C-methylase UbiE
MSQLVFDEEASRRIEALYLIRDAVRRRRLVRAALGAQPGEQILDLGCGPGFYCAEVLEEVGDGGAVVGLDSSEAMLALARRRCAEHANVELHPADALSLPVADGRFDGAICVQVLEYVEDVPAALRELHRALRPGGRVVLWDVDWATLSVHSEDDALTGQVLAAWDEHLAHPSLPRTLLPQLRAAGFEAAQMEAHVFATAGELDDQSYVTALMPVVSAFVPGRNGLTDEAVASWRQEMRRLGERGEFYAAVTQVRFTATKP